MGKDEKWIVGGSCILFGLVCLVLLFGIPLIYSGEALGWMHYFLSWPQRVFWSPSSLSGKFAHLFYVLIYGTFIYLLAGVPPGFLVVGVRRLFRWLNHEKWVPLL
jgi:hypothetical protein